MKPTISTSMMASVAATVASIQVGSAIVATRFVIDQTQPGSLALLRYTIGTLFLLLPLAASVRVSFARRDLVPLSLSGIFQFGVVVALLNYAWQYIPVAVGPEPYLTHQSHHFSGVKPYYGRRFWHAVPWRTAKPVFTVGAGLCYCRVGHCPPEC